MFVYSILCNYHHIFPIDKHSTLLLCLPPSELVAPTNLNKDTEQEIRQTNAQVLNSKADFKKYISGCKHYVET